MLFCKKISLDYKASSLKAYSVFCLCVCLSVTLVHPAKPLDGIRCHLAGIPVWSHVTLY